MNDWVIVTAITALYLCFVLIVGLKAKSDQASTLEGYVAGGRHMGMVLLFFIMGAEIFSAFSFLGGPGWAYSKGAPAFYIMAYLTLGIGIWWALGPRIMRLGRKFGYLTQAELLADRFSSKGLSVFVALVSIAALIPYLTVQITGAGMLFQAATNDQIPFWLGALVAFIVVTIYVYSSGLEGIGWTNLVQGIMMVVVAWVLGYMVADKFYGGIGEMFRQIKESAPEYLTLPGGGSGMPWGAFSSAILVSTFGGIMWPHLFMKFYSADSEKTLKKVFVLYPLYAYLLIPILIIGFAGILVFKDAPLAKADSVLLELLVGQGKFSPWIIGIMLSGALAAAMSTGANLAHTAATVFVRDFLSVLCKKPMADAQAVRLTKIFVVVISVTAYGLALSNPSSLVKLLLGAYGVIVQLLPLVLAALFWKRATTMGAYAGLFCGSLVTLVFQFFLPSPLGFNAGMWGLLANSVALVGVSLLTTRTAVDPEFGIACDKA